MTDVHILAIDLAKRSFQVCTTALGGAVRAGRAAFLDLIADSHRSGFVTGDKINCVAALDAHAKALYYLVGQ